MKCVIIGHTSKLGADLFSYFKNTGWETIGLSRSTGHNVFENYNEILQICNNTNLVIINTHNKQETLLQDLIGKVDKIIVSGSIMTDFIPLVETEYSQHKLDLKNRCKSLNFDPTVRTPILYLGISNLKPKTNDFFEYEDPLSNQTILHAISFWLDNPRVTNISFGVKITEHNANVLIHRFNLTKEKINKFIKTLLL